MYTDKNKQARSLPYLCSSVFIRGHSDFWLLTSVFLSSVLAMPASALDLKSSVVVAPATLAGPEKKAVAMLVDEVEKRTRIRLSVAETWQGAGPAIRVGQQSGIEAGARRLADRLIPAPGGTGGFACPPGPASGRS